MSNHLGAEDAGWPTSPELPLNKDGIYVCFHGLFGFAYNSADKSCEVATNAKSNEHEFGIFVVESDGDRFFNMLYKFTPDSPTDVESPVIVKVENPTKTGVRFYEAAKGGDEEMNWSRLPDVEGPIWHNRKVKKRKRAMKPRLSIKQGLFFTAVSTSPYKFNCVIENEEPKPPTYHQSIGTVPYISAAKLAPERGRVSLTFEDHEIHLTPTPGKTYVILFSNSCPDCDWKPDNPIKEKRNDFYCNYKLFEKPQSHHQYGIQVVSNYPKKLERDDSINFFEQVLNFALEKTPDRSSRASPCGGVGFGLSSGFDE
jgi:hypothetical protein